MLYWQLRCSSRGTEKEGFYSAIERCLETDPWTAPSFWGLSLVWFLWAKKLPDLAPSCCPSQQCSELAASFDRNLMNRDLNWWENKTALLTLCSTRLCYFCSWLLWEAGPALQAKWKQNKKKPTQMLWYNSKASDYFPLPSEILRSLETRLALGNWSHCRCAKSKNKNITILTQISMEAKCYFLGSLGYYWGTPRFSGYSVYFMRVPRSSTCS